MTLSGSRISSRVALGSLIVLCALLYGMILRAPVIYDDLGHVVGNPAWALSWPRFVMALFSRDYFSIFFERTFQPPVTLLHYIAHDSPAVFRGAGILLHALNGWLVFRLGRRLLRDDRAAFLAAILFCCHPAATETVAISAFKGHLFSAAFGLAALEAWLVYLDAGTGRTAAAAAAFYAAALCSKETALTIGLLCGLAWLLMSRRRRAWPGLAALAGVSVVYLTWRFLWLKSPANFPETFRYSPLVSLAWYVRALLWPWPLCIEHTAESGAWVWAALGGYGAVLIALRRRSAELWLALWIGVVLTPYLHFIAFANLSPVADRYLYLPVAGFCLLLGRLIPAPGLPALCVLGVVWGASAAARNGLYRGERSLAEQTAACAPANPRAWYGLGLACLKAGDPAAAEAAFQGALKLRESSGIYTMLGESLYQQGKRREALASYRSAQGLDPDWAVRFPDAARRLRELAQFTF